MGIAMPDRTADGLDRVRCTECEESVAFGWGVGGDLLLRCGCPDRGIDVTEAVGGNNLFDPLSGHWSRLDEDSRV